MVGASLEHVINNQGARAKWNRLANSNFYYVGPIGGWNDRVTALNLSILASILILPNYWVYEIFSFSVVLFRVFGTPDAIASSRNRFFVLQFFGFEGGNS